MADSGKPAFELERADSHDMYLHGDELLHSGSDRRSSSDAGSHDTYMEEMTSFVQIKTEALDYDMELPHLKRKKCKDTKLCSVCGDHALGYNFDAVTCESCKAFFRRNALRNTTSQCLFQGNCDITMKTRRFCPHCRLRKCVGVGMKKNMILDENERKARMAKVMQNRQKKKSVRLSQDHPDSSVNEVVYSPPSTSSGGSPTRMADFVPFTFKKDLQQQSDTKLYRQITCEEKELISDLKVAYEATLGRNQVSSDLQKGENYGTVNQLVNNSEIAVRRLIMFVKKLDDFRSLCQEDQIIVLKACVLNTLLLRSMAFYNIERDSWITPGGEIKTEILKKATGYAQLHDQHVSYCRELKSIIGNDLSIVAMLQAITLFNPAGDGITNRKLVSEIQDKYLILMKHFIESTYSYSLAQKVFSTLLTKISELKGLSDEHAKVLLQVNPSQIEPLMLEILNLK